MKYWLAGLFITISTNILAEDVVVYRWVDNNNVVHFSQNQPASGNYTEILMASNGQPKKPLGSVSNDVSKVKSDNVKLPTVDTSSQCEEAKTNLKTLTTFDRIRYTDENGETKILGEEQQKEQIITNKSRIKEYCK